MNKKELEAKVEFLKEENYKLERRLTELTRNDVGAKIVKLPRLAGHGFLRDLFNAAKESGVPIVFAKSVKLYSAVGGGATINLIDRLFGFGKRQDNSTKHHD